MATPNESGATAQFQAEAESQAAPVWAPQPVRSEAHQLDGSASMGVATNEPAAQAPEAGRSSPARPVVRARRAGSTTALLVISALVAIGGVGFAVGRVTGGTGTDTSSVSDQNGLAGLGADASGRPGFGAGGPGIGLTSGTATVSGTVVSATSDAMTIQLASGQTVTLAIGSSTTYHNQASANSADVATGATVIVQTSGGSGVSASASASPGIGTGGTRTATDVTITGN
jgi:hypothetical protein